MYFIKKDFFEKNDKKERNDIIIAIVVIIVFSFFIYKLMFSKEKLEEVDESVVVLNDPEVKNSVFAKAKTNEEDYLYTNSKVYKRKIVEAEDAFVVQSDSAVIISDIVSNSTIIDEVSESKVSEINAVKEVSEENTIVKEELTNIKNEGVENSQDIKEELTTIENQIDEVNNVEVKEEVFEELTEKANEVTEAVVAKAEERKEDLTEVTKTTTPIVEKAVVEKKAINETFNCVIVVGAFKEESNKTAVIDKLKSLGYSHTDGLLRRGLNYVGVPVDCNNKNRKRTLLRELNEAFGIESWIKKK